MTSRPPKGVPPRQAQRGPSTQTSQSQSQQYLPTPVGPSAPPEPADVLSVAGQSRHHGATPRRGGSKLRLELSSDWIGDLSTTTDSPHALPPSSATTQPPSVPDAAETDKASPAVSRGSPQQEIHNLALPMPKRRLRHPQRPEPAPRPPPIPVASLKKDSRPKPYVILPPSDAPRFASTRKIDSATRDPFSKGLHSGFADFFPWTGQHHEDEWSSDAIQKGTWDRGNQSETSSARSAVLPALRQKSGLSALSTVLLGVMNQRRFRGQILAPSTFKPPPRVTLTDTKREVWLKDLANPAISLRRLSRTIPHGIRGTVLLEHCLNKNVPLERAVWFAKCVGANEIRAFKRKGANGTLVMGGESMWMRDWSTCVEQFVEAALLACGEQDWKAHMTYAYARRFVCLLTWEETRLIVHRSIRLATHFFSEHLLDRDRYLGWIVSGLENSPQSRLPMWMLLAQITWANLVRSRKHGRRLVYTLLGHLNAIHHDPDRDLLLPLSSQLMALLETLLKENPESFVFPAAWADHREALWALLPSGNVASRAAFHKVSQRNARLLVPDAASPSAGRQYLVKLLDSTLKGWTDDGLPAKCFAAVPDGADLIRTVVEWATSTHRPGSARIYVALRLIQSWKELDVGVTAVVVNILDDMDPQDRPRKRAMFGLVAELVRSGLFSVSQYMQWLIGRGGLHDAVDIDPVHGPCASRLLVELPVRCLTESQRAQRGTLLRRAGHFSVSDEARDISNALSCVDDTCGLNTQSGNVEQQNRCLPQQKLLRRVHDSSKAVQTSICDHLTDALSSELLAKVDSVAALSIFDSVRAVVESSDDFSALSRILERCSATSDIDVLASSADTVNSHLEAFLALGSADSLFDTLVARRLSLSREQGAAARPLLAALTSLAPRLPRREGVARQLAQELVRSDRSNAIDACSPVSDSMAAQAQAQSGEGEVSEQMDKLLASGNTVDPPTMNRLFRNIIPKVEAGWFKADGRRRTFASLLGKLRVFDVQHFDKLMADWVSHIGTLPVRPALSELYPLLVSLGCLSVPVLLNTASAANPVTAKASSSTGLGSPPTGSTVYMQELLRLFVAKLPRACCLDTVEAYRFEIQQKSARAEHGKALLSLMRNALAEYAAIRSLEPGRECILDGGVCRDGLVDTLRYLVVADSSTVENALRVGGAEASAATYVNVLVARLLAPDGSATADTSFDELLGLTNELSMPFCQLKLTLDLSDTQPGLSADGKAGVLEAFARAMDRAIEARNILWTSMLPCLSPNITRSLSTQAHARFLDLVPSPRSTESDDEAAAEVNIRLAENLLGVVEAIVRGQPPSKPAHFATKLVDKLCDLWDMVASRDERQARARAQVLSHWIPALLRFIVLHSAFCSDAVTTSSNAGQPGPVQPPGPPPHDTRARIILALCGLLVELNSRPHAAQYTLSQQVLDVALLLVDDLPEDVQLQCAKSVLYLSGGTSTTSTSSDARLYYLFSVEQPSWADDLKLAHKERASIAYSAAARGMSTLYGIGPASHERLSPYVLRRWEVLSEPTPHVGENDTSLSLGLFETIKIQ